MDMQNVVDLAGPVWVSLGKSTPTRPPESGAAESAVGRPQVGETSEITPESDLFDTPDPWYAVHVQGRREDRFVTLMHAAGVRVFYPTMVIRRRERRREKGRRHEHRLVNATRPLWRGYCFIAGDAEAIYAAKATNVIYSVHPPAVQSMLITALRRAAEWCGRHGNVPQPKYIRPGSDCVVTAGAFMGFQGRWEAGKGGRGHLLCTFAGQPNTPIHIDVELLEPI